MTPTVDKELEQFSQDLMQSIREMNGHIQGLNNGSKVHHVALSHITEARQKAGYTQMLFAQLLGVSVRTLQEWEQGRRKPSGAAETLLKIAIKHPEVLKDI
jgi:putative transcriptional regulator